MPSTPPPSQAGGRGIMPRPPPTPEQVRRLEEDRLKAKALRENHALAPSRSNHNADGGVSKKRPHSLISKSFVPTNNRDASLSTSTSGRGLEQLGSNPRPSDAEIRPAKKFEKYIEYDFSTMTDTKGGFLSSSDDPHNRVLHAKGAEVEERPAHMTLAEWERHQILKKLKAQRSGPFDPGISAFNASDGKKCRECGSLDIDWKWDEIFGCKVCGKCKEQYPDKYSLLTKTEAREDYLLTDPELKDEELLPRLERPNPHKSSYASMQLFLRYQVEEYAFSEKKWGSSAAMDAEFERREVEKKKRKDAKFRSKLADLKKRTRVEAYKRSREGGLQTGAEAQFGDRIGGLERHVHEWGRSLEDPETGMMKKRCVDCGMEVEELEL